MNFRNLLVLSVLALFVGACGKNANIGSSAKMESELDTVSYALGADVANSLKDRNGLTELNYEAFVKGMREAFEQDELSMGEAERRNRIRTYLKQLSQRRNQENLKKGEEFLAENKENDDVSVTESGLQYEVIEEGSGVSPDANDTVKVHYIGKTIDGDTFDSSGERDEPATFAVNQVIEGWTEGLQLMKEGAKYKLFIPTDLAYGTQVQPGGEIEPNEALIFEVELLEVNKVPGTEPKGQNTQQ
ncbi:MAG: FKBP-type peptidyl-prolyl cis-trans isomerase [Bacteroidales bacterium]